MFDRLLAFMDDRADYAPARRVCLPGLWHPMMGVAGSVDMKTGTITVYLGFCSHCYMDPIENPVIWTVAHEHRHLQQLASNGRLPVPVTGWRNGEYSKYQQDKSEADADAFASRILAACPEELKQAVREESMLVLDNSPAWLKEHPEQDHER